LKKEKSNKAKAEALQHAIIEHIEKHYEEDPEFYERFSDKLKVIIEEYKNNWETLASELEQLRDDMKRGRDSEETFGFNPKSEVPFLGLLKQELFGKKNIRELGNSEINFLVNLTRDIIEIVKKEIQVIDFWENYTKQKKLRSYIISHLLDKIPNENKSNTMNVRDRGSSYYGINKKLVFTKRNEIAQKIMELAYHIYGR